MVQVSECLGTVLISTTRRLKVLIFIKHVLLVVGALFVGVLVVVVIKVVVVRIDELVGVVAVGDVVVVIVNVSVCVCVMLVNAFIVRTRFNRRHPVDGYCSRWYN